MNGKRLREIIDCINYILNKPEKVYTTRRLTNLFSPFTLRTVNAILLKEGAIKRRSKKVFEKVDENKIKQILADINKHIQEVFVSKSMCGRKASIKYLLLTNPSLANKLKIH